MRRSLSIAVVAVLLLSSIPTEAMAQVIKTSLSVNPLGPSIGLPVSSPSPLLNSGLPANSPSLSLSLSVPLLPAPSISLPLSVSVTPKANPEVVAAVAVKAAKPQPPQAAPQMDSPSASALFDGIALRSSPAVGDPDPVIPDDVPQARIPRRRDMPQRFTSRLARWTGAAALYSVYRDGILVQRYAARLNNQSLSPARRTAAARLLASLNRVEAVPTLGWAYDNDPSPHVRRAALDALLHITRAAEPRLLRSLKTNPRAGSREAAATTLSWVVRHSDAPGSVEALAAAGMLDLAEDTRLAAIRALSLAKSPKALESLEWMRGQEARPHMRSAIAMAVAESQRRHAAAGLQRYRPPDDELSDTRGPLHAVALKRAMAVATVFVIVEMIGGFMTGNVALKADAMHLAADQLINGAALFSIWMARRPPNSRKSFGYLKVESVVGLLGAAAIAFMGFEMGVEAWHRIFTPGAVATWSVALFALASLAANLFSALILWRHHGESLSMKGAFLHAMTDAIGSFGVIVSVAAAILLGWAWVEPVAVAVIVVLIVKTAWGLGKPAWDVLIDAVPDGTDLDRIEADLLAIPGVAVVKDLHVWALNSQTTALTATVFIHAGADHDAVLASAKAALREKYNIRHVTVQVETIPGAGR